MKKPRFNIIDLLIVLVIAVVLAAGAYILKSKTGTQTKTNEAEVVFIIEEKDVDESRAAYYKENAAEGNTVSVGIKEKVSGTLKNIEINPSKQIYTNPKTGEKEWKEEIGKFDICFTVRAKITETEKDFLIGTAKIKVGQSQSLVGQSYSAYGTVVSVSKVGGDK